MKKITAIVFALIAATTFIYAEGQKDNSDIPAFDPNKEYNLSIGGYGDLEIAYRAVFETEEFKSKYPNINIEYQMADFDGHHNRLTTVLAAGEATNDIEALEVGYIAKFVEGGGLTNLASAPFNGQEVGKDIVKFAMANATTRKGNLVAMPVDIAPAVLFYRKSLADKAGIDFDNLKSWDEFIEVSKKLVADSDGDGTVDKFAIPHASEVAMMPLNGGKSGWFNKKGQALEPKEKFISSLELVRDIRQAGIDGDLAAWTGPWTQSFADGTVAAIVNGAWFGGSLKSWIAPDLAGDWRVAYLPGKTYAFQGGTYLSIPQNVPAEQKAAAWEIIKYLTTTANAQLTTFKTIDAYPALTTVYDTPIMHEPVPYFGGQKVREIYADVAKHIPSDTVTEYDAAVLAVFNNAITDVIVNGVTPEDAYQKALKEIAVIAD
ncbi:extracellular solute-binding protein [Spirochaeta cellobiosiphila]|uniref:extracellular solute-binding protein n=1 Tax=Spirochaeta cellobiosiphila TaxID=504483 RepID=UPI00042144C3|nr:extracellular solute-binding protein [Spirochaeta cellobiosiphila]